jgi:integrative and conjugative element protein (TIGR02256 family)
MKKFTIGSYVMFLGDELIEILFSYRQIKRRSPESGGILLGQMKDDEIFLLRVSTPNPKDVFNRTGFTRNKETAQIIINHEFLNSGKKTIYLGEWHSHPEDHPSPSNQDSKMIKDQFNKNCLNEEFIIIIIVGNLSIFIGILDSNGFYKLNIPWDQLR